MSSKPCIFCKICAKEEPTDLIYEDEEIVIFKDIKPAAKWHYLAVPKVHIKDGKSLTMEHKALVETLVEKGKRAIKDQGGDINDLRMGFHWPPFNSISHLHLHLISPANEMSFISKMIFRPNSYWFYTAEYVLQEVLPKQKL